MRRKVAGWAACSLLAVAALAKGPIGVLIPLGVAVAAGLLGMGTAFAGTAEGAAKMLYAGLKGVPEDEPLDGIARAIVDRELDAKRPIFGIGHNLHKPIDPRTPVLFAIAEEQGYRGRYVALMEAMTAAY